MVEMVRRIGEKEGFGSLFGEGVKRAAENIGGMDKEYAIHAKGLELPAHDPRAGTSLAIQYTTGNTGGSHIEAIGAMMLENYTEMPAEDTFRASKSPDLGFPVRPSRFATK